MKYEIHPAYSCTIGVHCSTIVAHFLMAFKRPSTAGAGEPRKVSKLSSKFRKSTTGAKTGVAESREPRRSSVFLPPPSPADALVASQQISATPPTQAADVVDEAQVHAAAMGIVSNSAAELDHDQDDPEQEEEPASEASAEDAYDDDDGGDDDNDEDSDDDAFIGTDDKGMRRDGWPAMSALANPPKSTRATRRTEEEDERRRRNIEALQDNRWVGNPPHIKSRRMRGLQCAPPHRACLPVYARQLALTAHGPADPRS